MAVMAALNFDRNRTAVLVMDYQQGVVSRMASDDADRLLKTMSGAIAAAHEASVLVIYVRIGFRPGAPEISDNNRTFAAIAHATGGFGLDDEATRIDPVVAPRPSDPVVIKKRVSAFAGSDLELLLRSRQIDTLVLAGIATSGVVLSTLREAADRDYELLVLSDCCFDRDAEVHRVLMDKVFPRQATVLSVEELRRRLGEAS
jgi:nicotinamidase-related amidase